MSKWRGVVTYIDFETGDFECRVTDGNIRQRMCMILEPAGLKEAIAKRMRPGTWITFDYNNRVRTQPLTFFQ